MSSNGQAPFQVSDVDPTKFGSGGGNVVPGQGNPAMGPVLNDLLARIYKAVASTAGLTASLAKDRVDGQLAVTLDTYTLWIWKAADATAADGNHIAPTDVGGGNGRWVAMAMTGTGVGQEQRITIDIPLATIQSKTSGVAFNIGSVLPTNARVNAVELNVIATLTGGTISAAVATVQGGTDAAGSLIASTDVFTATGTFDTPGSNPYASRSGQQLKMTITSTGDTLAHATTGHLSVDVLYDVVP